MVEPALLAAQPQADTLQSPGPDSYEADLADDEVLELLSRVEAHRRMQSTNVRKESSTQQVAKLEHGSLDSPCIRTEGNISRIDSSRILSKDERDLANRTRKVEDPVIVKQNLAQKKKATAGEDWFNLPRTNLSTELKRDLQLLGMRNVLDPKSHYKKDATRSKVPEFSQVGTIIQGPTEYYSARLQNKDRKQTFVEDVLSAEASTGRFKRDYTSRQATKMSGKKKYYKELKAKRSPKV